MKVWQITMDEIAEAVAELQRLAEHPDTEHAHAQADRVLSKLMPPEIREAYESVEKWFS